MALPTPKIFCIKNIVCQIYEYVKYDNNLPVCNKFLNNFLKKFRYYYLNIEYSLKYCNDEEFRKLIQSKIPSSKLSLNLSCCYEITDAYVSMLGGLHTLDSSHCEQITDLSHCEQITDVSMLGGLHTLDLSHCEQITDVLMLGRLHTLNL